MPVKKNKTQKQIVAIWNQGNRGKTETVRQLAFQFLQKYPDAESVFPNPKFIPLRGNFRLIVRIVRNGITLNVGFESQGDPSTNLNGRLRELASDFNCDIIFCTCRTSGATPRAIQDIAFEFDHNILWDSTYESADEALHAVLNLEKAKHILSLLAILDIV